MSWSEWFLLPTDPADIIDSLGETISGLSVGMLHIHYDTRSGLVLSFTRIILQPPNLFIQIFYPSLISLVST